MKRGVILMSNESLKKEAGEMKLPATSRETKPATLKGSAPSVDRLSDLVCRELIRRATDMLIYSYAPYSNFKVGAALMAKNRQIYTGCNIENAAFGQHFLRQ